MVKPPKYWIKAWIAIVLFEGLLLCLQGALSPDDIIPHLLSPNYYPFIWLLHMLLTILLWAILNAFDGKKTWQIILFNGLIFISYFVVWVVIVTLFYANAPGWLIHPRAANYTWQQVLYESWPEIGRYLIKVVGFYALRHYFNYRKSAQQRIELAVINKELQLKLLQEQLSPHFYFNTLNNLYGLALSGNTKLSDALHQLSSIMKYVIEDCNHEVVPLQSEIHFLQSYLALEKLRYEAGTFIEMRVDGTSDGQTIMPMLLIQFLENAFKHGLHEKAPDDWLKVFIKIRESELNFVVQNSFNKPAVAEGIGLQSARKRLQIKYPGKHQMEITENGQSFTVQLKLELQHEAA